MTNAVWDRLEQPDRAVSWNQLLENWTMSRLTIVLPGYAALVDHPRVLLKLRGALGEALMRGASLEARAGKICPWSPPCANDVFFGPKPNVKLPRGTQEVPKPFVLSCEAIRQDLVLHMTVFGFAVEWASDLRTALLSAVREFMPWALLASSMPGEPNNRAFIPADPAPIVKITVPKIDAIPSTIPQSVLLEFKTGLDCKNFDPAERPQSVIAALARRLWLLARWQGVEISDDWGALVEAWRALQYQTDIEKSVTINRKSRRNGKAFFVPIRKLNIALEGDLTVIFPLILMGAVTHCGRATNTGLGRYVLNYDRGSL